MTSLQPESRLKIPPAVSQCRLVQVSAQLIHCLGDSHLAELLLSCHICTGVGLQPGIQGLTRERGAQGAHVR
jgi:hypothetical protein